LANIYTSQGRYEEAEPLYLQALDMFRQSLGEEHPNIALNLNNLANIYTSQGRYEEAEPLYLQALDMFRQSLGDEHPHTQTVLKNYQIFLEEKNESKSL
jgi:tetratricopeptide (TPR) repeat protein